MKSILVLTACLGMVSGALAGTPALEITTGATPKILDVDITAGWVFTVNQDTRLTFVGLWDHELNGIQTSHELRIWSAGGDTELASAVIPQATVAIAQGPPQVPGIFRYVGIPPLTLLAGMQYVIGARVDGDDYLNSGVTSITAAPEIAWVEGRFTTSRFGFPTNTVEGNKYIGPNIMFEDLGPQTALPQAGSKLVFPVHRTGPDYFTIISGTNTNLLPATPQTLGGGHRPLRVREHGARPGGPLRAPVVRGGEPARVPHARGHP